MKKIFLSIFLFACLSLTAQIDTYNDSLRAEPSADVDYAMEVTNRLCDYSMYGRGIAKEGDKVAAQYIADELKSIGAEPIGRGYMQPFYISANVFPKRMTLQLGTDYLVPGVDFIIDPTAPSVSGTYDAVTITRADMLNQMTLMDKLRQAKGNFLIIDNNNYEGEKRDQTQKINMRIDNFRNDAKVGVKGVIVYDTLRVQSWSSAAMQTEVPVFYVFKKDVNLENVAEIKVAADADFLPKYQTQNVIARIKGSVKPEEYIVIACHYDHLGMMGEGVYSGANNGASGVAMMLSLAKHYAMIPPAYSVVFIAFGANEFGRAGGNAFIKNPSIPLSKIKLLVNFDMMGCGYDGVRVINGTSFPEYMNILTKIAREYRLVKNVEAVRNLSYFSEHFAFSNEGVGVKSMMVCSLGGDYTTRKEDGTISLVPQLYKQIQDTKEMIPYTKFAEMKNLFIRFFETLK